MAGVLAIALWSLTASGCAANCLPDRSVADSCSKKDYTMPNNSGPMVTKLYQLNPPAIPLLDSEFVAISGTTDKAEIVQTDQGRFISSPVDGWLLHPCDGG